ncbi:MAG: TPM domain-containing protein [Oscillospiraceae bacterium]|nr:TPM domain-containing protein [Oscillospiraceae bacterium]
MKKLLLTLLAAVLMVVLFVSPALAADLANVTDAAELLTEQQAATLEQMAEEVSERYGCGVYIVTVGDYRDLEDTDVQTCAEDLYDYFDLGIGEEKNGILLMLSMDDRDYALVAYGQKAHYSFTDYGSRVLAEEFLDNFRRDDWYGGFYDYIQKSGEMLALAEAGTPVDTYEEDYEDWHSEMTRADRIKLSVGIGLVLGIIIAAITCGVFKRQMKNAVKAVGAERYIAKENGMVMNEHYDRFTHQTVHRERIVREQRGSGGGGHGGGTTVNSHGFSGHSGKF